MSKTIRLFSKSGSVLLPVLTLLIALGFSNMAVAPALAGGGVTPTATFSGITIQKIPLVLATPVPISSSLLKFTTVLTLANQLNASLDVQSPPSIPLGDSKVITLQITPSTLQSKSSQIRAKLSGVNFQIADDGQPDKTLTPGVPVKWSWVVSSSTPGSQALLLAIYYLDQKGNVQAQWDNLPINIDISGKVVPSPTPENLSDQILKNLADNSATLIGVAVTLILGLLGLYLQYGRKGKSDKEKK